MANSIWQATVQNATGDIIPGAEMTVVDENTGLTATIFSSIGGAALTNPFFADSEGFAQFYAASGTYRVTANDTGTGQTITWRYIRFGDAASRDVGTDTGNIPDADALNMVGNTNYTSGNLVPFNIEPAKTSALISAGFAFDAGVAVFPYKLSAASDPLSITVTSTFKVFRGDIVVAAGVVPVLGTSSSKTNLVLNVAGLTLTTGEPLQLYADNNNSKITVNF